MSHKGMQNVSQQDAVFLENVRAHADDVSIRNISEGVTLNW
jgi:hypothetical protein